jgi:hypothetical protein
MTIDLLLDATRTLHPENAGEVVTRRAATLFASQTLRWLEAGVTPSDAEIESAWNLAVERARGEE